MLSFFKILSILAFFSFPILAQNTGRDSVSMGDTLSIKEILVESNRIKMTNLDAPNKLQVLDEKTINSLNGSRLYDALETSDALFVKDYGFNSGIKIIAFNSTQSEHTLILLDGVRLNSRQNAQTDLSLYDIDNAGRIEISKGGSSALYGSEAIGGVINIITKDADISKPFGLSLKADVGSYGLRKFYGKVSQGFKLGSTKSISYDVSYMDERAKNNYEYNFKNGLNVFRKERENADFNSQAFSFNSRFAPNASSYFKLYVNYGYFERGSPGVDLGYSPGTARQLDHISLASLTYSNDLSKKVSLKTNVSYKYQLQKYFDPSTLNLPVKLNSFYKLNSYINTTSLNYTAKNFEAESGYEISLNNIISNETEKGNLFQGAVFTSLKFVIPTSLISKITFYPSVRYDHYSNIAEKNVVTGKFGVNLKPFAKADFSLKSSFGNNFGAPTFNELYWNQLGNKNLKPERSISFDAGLYYGFTLLTQNEMEVSYYNINTTDRIVWTPVGGIWRPINIGKVVSEGVDVSLKSALISFSRINASLSLNYTYGSAIKKNEDFPGDPSYGKQMIYIPKEMIKAAFMFNYLTTTKILKSVYFNLFYRFATRRYMNFENTVFAPRYDVVDANIGFSMNAFKSELNLKFMANNLFDEDYQVISGYPMPLRNYKFEIGFKF